MNPHRFAFPLAAAALAAGWPAAPAHACSNLPNICEQQDQQNQAEQARLAAENNAAAIEDYTARHPRVDPTQVRLDALSSMDDAFHAMGEAAPMIAQEVVKNRKEIERIKRGSWDFYQDTAAPVAGEFCSALFVNPEGVVRLSGPGGDYRGALLTFWGLAFQSRARSR